jgi:hypothetical protein
MLAARDKLQLQRLLLQRKAAFDRLATIEASIRDLARTDAFPFPAPAHIPPSTLPPTKQPRSKQKAKTTSTSQPPRLRRLRDNEAAYRVTFHGHPQTAPVCLTDPTIVQQLLDNRPHLPQVARVETIDLSAIAIDMLWQQDPAVLPKQ